jgi:hypothetical protein
MGGYFSDIALDSYRSLVIELQGADFAEGAYDFTRCVKPSGEAYGTAGQCRKGVQEDKSEGAKKRAKTGGMRITKKIKTLGVEDLKRVLSDPRINDKQKEMVKNLLVERGNTTAAKVTRPAKSEVTVKVDKAMTAKVKVHHTPEREVAQDTVLVKRDRGVTEGKLKAVFDRAVGNLEKTEREGDTLRGQGVLGGDPRWDEFIEKREKAFRTVTLLRAAYHAVRRNEFLQAAGEEKKLLDKSDALFKQAHRELKKSGLDVYTLPENHQIKGIFEQSRKIRDLAGFPRERMVAAYFGEPAKISKIESDGGGKVDAVVPSRVPKGGASLELKEFLEGAEVVMAFKPTGFSKFVKEGVAKNGFEAGTGGVKVGQRGYLKARKNGEMATLGIPLDADPAGRPKYAALENPNRSRSLQGGDSLMSNYGGIQVVFNSSVKDRTTFTMGDSLNDAAVLRVMASPVRDPSNPVRQASGAQDKSVKVDFSGGPHSGGIRVSTAYGPAKTSYVEAQIHGALKTSDIKEVRYYKGHEVPAGTRKLLEKQGVEIVELPPKMENLKVYRDNPNFKDITAINPT